MTDRRTFDLTIAFKGARTYVAGTDIYTHGIAAIAGVWPDIDGRCRLAFHKLARGPLAISMGDSIEAGAHADDVAEFHITGGIRDAHAWVRERPGTIADRYDFDEPAVIAACEVTGETISLVGNAACTTIEAIVAMTKHLHERLRPTVAGSWIFTRLDIARLLRESDKAGLKIQLGRSLGERLTQSEIRSAGSPIGAIYFSVGVT